MKLMFELNLSRSQMLKVQDYAKERGASMAEYADPKVTMKKIKEACDRRNDGFWRVHEYTTSEGVPDLPSQTITFEVSLFVKFLFIFRKEMTYIFLHFVRASHQRAPYVQVTCYVYFV